MLVCSINPVFLNLTENQQQPSTVHSDVRVNSTEGYLELVASDDYIGPSTTTRPTDDSGYLVPVDSSPGPVPYYIVPLPSPKSKTTDANPAGPRSPGTNSGYLIPFESDADDENYLKLSTENKSSDTYTKLQLRDNDVGSSSTD